MSPCLFICICVCVHLIFQRKTEILNVRHFLHRPTLHHHPFCVFSLENSFLLAIPFHLIPFNIKHQLHWPIILWASTQYFRYSFTAKIMKEWYSFFLLIHSCIHSFILSFFHSFCFYWSCSFQTYGIDGWHVVNTRKVTHKKYLKYSAFKFKIKNNKIISS